MRLLQAWAQSWNSWNFKKCPEMSWNSLSVLKFVQFVLKFWKSDSVALKQVTCSSIWLAVITCTLPMYLTYFFLKPEVETECLPYCPKVHYIVSMRCEKEQTSDGAWMSTTAWRVSVLSVGDSMHEVRRWRMHSHQFAARFLVGRGRHCWKPAVKSVMECSWPAWW